MFLRAFRLALLIAIASISLNAIFNLPSSARVFLQSAQPHTVIDYYRLLPDKYFEATREQRFSWMLDPKRGAVVDVSNGYLYAAGDGAQTDIYVCLFKRLDGTYLVAVKSHESDSDIYTYLDFYIYDKGRLQNVTKQSLPMKFDKELKYELPRYGTTVKVTDENGKRVYDLVWINGKFKLKRA